MGIKLTPITAFQDTQQTTTSTSITDDNCETAALADGVDYLVLHSGNMGGSSTSNLADLRLYHGSTELSQGIAEGLGGDNHYQSGECQGNLIVTGNGTDTLKFRVRTSSGTGYFGSMAIVAIPLDNLTLNTDYFHSGVASSAAIELADASLSGETVRTVEFTVPDAGDYICIMSVEGQASDSGSASNAARVRWLLDGTTEIAPTETGIGHLQEWEDNLDWNPFQICSLLTLTAGAHDFEIEGWSRVDAEANFRRSRITLIRADSFVQVVQTRNTAGADTFLNVWQPFMSQTFTPTANNHIVHMAYTVPGVDDNTVCRTSIFNDTDTQRHRTDSGEYNNDNGFDSARDLVPVTMFHSQQYSTAKDWEVNFRVGTGGDSVEGCVGRNRANTVGIESNFIIWELETAAEDNQGILLGFL